MIFEEFLIFVSHRGHILEGALERACIAVEARETLAGPEIGDL